MQKNLECIFISTYVDYSTYPIPSRYDDLDNAYLLQRHLTYEHMFMMLEISAYIDVNVCNRVRLSDNSRTYDMSQTRIIIRQHVSRESGTYILINVSFVFNVYLAQNVLLSGQGRCILTHIQV